MTVTGGAHRPHMVKYNIFFLGRKTGKAAGIGQRQLWVGINMLTFTNGFISKVVIVKVVQQAAACHRRSIHMAAAGQQKRIPRHIKHVLAAVYGVVAVIGQAQKLRGIYNIFYIAAVFLHQLMFGILQAAARSCRL